MEHCEMVRLGTKETVSEWSLIMWIQSRARVRELHPSPPFLWPSPHLSTERIASKYLKSTCLNRQQSSPARQEEEMGLMVPNEAERPPKLQRGKLSGWREGQTAAGEPSHGWEKAQEGRQQHEWRNARR